MSLFTCVEDRYIMGTEQSLHLWQIMPNRRLGHVFSDIFQKENTSDLVVRENTIEQIKLKRTLSCVYR